MIQKIIKIENDLVLPLPNEIAQALQLEEGSEITVSVDHEKKQILIQSVGQSADLGEINQEFAEQVTAFIRDYKPALDQLSNLDF